MKNTSVLFFCMFVLGVLILGMKLQKHNDNKMAGKFTNLLYAMGFYIALNIASELLDGHPEQAFWLYVVNVLVFNAVDLVIIMFSVYLCSFINSKGNRNAKMFNIIIDLCILRMIMVIGLVISGNLFIVENGYYVESGVQWPPYVLTVVIMGLLTWQAIANKDCFSKTQLIVIVTYIFFPLIPVLAEYILNKYALTPMALTISILLIYVFVQAVNVEESQQREKLLDEISNTDLLTHMPNRRAYYNKLNSLNADENVGVLFCDINNLKYTNDHFGHLAGDDLIVKFANMFVKFFGDECVYRISGDEFVGLSVNVSQSVFNANAEAFMYEVKNCDNIAAVGSAYGSASCINTLVSEAESEMYLEKEKSKQEKYR